MGVFRSAFIYRAFQGGMSVEFDWRFSTLFIYFLLSALQGWIFRELFNIRLAWRGWMDSGGSGAFRAVGWKERNIPIAHYPVKP